MFYSIHSQGVQDLMPADFPVLQNIRLCFVQRKAEHFFVSSVLFTDETRFGRDGIINIHNQHQWEGGNPHGVDASSSSALICGQGLFVIIW
jgi:hypothetical protein